MGYAQGYFRFAFLPLVLVLFDQTIRRRSRGWCAGLMAALVAQAILVPETALMAAGILVTLVAFEFLGRPATRAVGGSAHAHPVVRGVRGGVRRRVGGRSWPPPERCAASSTTT